MTTLDRLSRDRSPIVREFVAGNPHTHKKTLKNLLNDERKLVANIAMKNLENRRKK
jgi:hypothetical protein